MSPEPPPAGAARGLLAALFAYFCWGVLPLYWRPMHDVPPLEILAHRVVWSVLFLLLVLALQRRWAWLAGAARKPKLLAAFVASACLLAVNWFVYVWAVNSRHVVEASLGYFINPLVNLVLGRFVLGERLRPLQTLAVTIAFLGVALLTWSLSALPTVSLILAVTFSVYGLLRKIAPLGSLEGLTLESIALGVPAAVYLLWLEHTGVARFGHAGALTSTLLAGTGVVTAVPLLAFAVAARTLPLSVLGIVQYLSPTLQFLLGVVVFHEAFSMHKLVAFVFIWTALLVFSVEGYLARRRRERG